ncbi:MAG: hypothetical protein ABSD64_09210 [Terriglobales bacterium]
MKFSYRLLAFTMALVWGYAAWGPMAGAAPRPKEKEKAAEEKIIDSGSFGVFQNGHRVGTETFSIYQSGSGSVIRSEFKTDSATTPAVQNSELHLTAGGEIRRYEWKELSPEQAELQVVPNDDFLTQKWRSGPQGKEKEHEQPYLLSLSTSILDDYFFIHREVLAWKFLAIACKQEKGQVQCPLKQHTQFATLNPHEQASATVDAEFLGRETVKLKTGPQDLIKLELKNDAGTWQLWLDEQFKVMRISVLGEKTEVERD